MCSRCAAEWAEARSIVEDKEYDDDDLPDFEDEDFSDEDQDLGCVDCEDEIYTGHEEAGSYCESCGYRPSPISEL